MRLGGNFAAGFLAELVKQKAKALQGQNNDIELVISTTAKKPMRRPKQHFFRAKQQPGQGIKRLPLSAARV